MPVTEKNRDKNVVHVLSIGELAERTGVSRRSIRHYEEQELLAPVRADNGYRVFPEKAVTRVRQIQRFISAGFSLQEIRSFPECMLVLDGASPCPETIAAQRQRLATLNRQIADLQRRKALLEVLLEESGEERSLTRPTL